MPLNAKGEKILGAMQKQYGEKEGKSVFYASKNKGTVKGVDTDAQDEGVGGGVLDLFKRDQIAGMAVRSAGGPIASAIGGSSGSAQRIASTMLSPMSSTPTASQAHENAIMGRPANAGSFGQAPVTGDSHRVAASLADLAKDGGAR